MKYFLKLQLLFILCFTPSIWASANHIEELILENGLKIIVKPDHRVPSAVFQIWYKVGSADEKKGSTGISHLLEHLIFLADKNILLSDSFNHLNNPASIGNAYTSRDYTFYYHILSKENLSLAFAIESNRMQYLSPSKEEVAIEKKVIWEETFSKIGEDPFLPAYNKLYELAFKNHAYQFPVIGRLEDLENLSLEQSMAWYKKYYRPDNAIVVIVGDVKAGDVFKLARHYFAAIERSKTTGSQKITTKKIKKTTQKTTNIHFIMPDTIKVGAVLLAYRVPSINTSLPAWEAYAVELMAGWFETGINTRLTRVLIQDRQLATEINISYSSMSQENTLFIIEAIPTQDTSMTHLEKALLDEIEKIKSEIISPYNLQKLKNQMTAVEIFDRDSMYIQAKIIGQAESIGMHWSDDAQYISNIKKITAQQMQKVLQQYFIADNQIIVIQNAHQNSHKAK